MARMVPPVPHPDCDSDGELELFHKVKSDPRARNWTVIHSLWLANHPRQQSGEADFIVIVPRKGVLVLEVKAYRSVRLEAGGWFYGSSTTPEHRGPFRQASQAMHAIRGRLHRDRPQLKGALFWSAVLFTHSRFEQDSVEWHRWQVLDSRAFRDGSIAAKLEAILDQARRHVAELGQGWFDPASATPTPVECDRIAEYLRPSYEPLESPADRKRTIDRDLRRATDEQLRILDCCESNARILVQGPAGTGKTLLAMAMAEREVAEAALSNRPRRILVLCFNKLLRKWLDAEMAPLRPAVEVHTLAGLMCKIVGRSPDDEVDEGFWATLPERTVEALLDASSTKWVWDTMVVDEAQDLLGTPQRDVLDLLIDGGLRQGRWRFLGDFERQSIYETNPDEVKLAIDELSAHGFELRLRDNCRNTPSTAHLAEQLGGLRPPYRRILRKDDGRSFRLQYFSGPEQQLELLERILHELRDNGFKDREITVLSTKNDAAAAAGQLPPPWKDRVVAAARGNEGGIAYASVYRFKGLESRAIVLTDVEGISTSRSRDIFYVGITRTQSHLHILCHETMRRTVTRLMIEQGLPTEDETPDDRQRGQ